MYMNCTNTVTHIDHNYPFKVLPNNIVATDNHQINTFKTYLKQF